MNLEPKVEMIDTYPKEAVEHIVDQLIKLNQECNRENMRGSTVTYKEEIIKAMKTLNGTLEQSLTLRKLIYETNH